MATFAELQTQWTEAKSAYHNIMIGKMTTEVWRDGRRVKSVPAEASALASYIADLEGQMIALDSSAAATLGITSTGQRFAVGVIFGG